jgi:hypothetical protein
MDLLIDEGLSFVEGDLQTEKYQYKEINSTSAKLS